MSLSQILDNNNKTNANDIRNDNDEYDDKTTKELKDEVIMILSLTPDLRWVVEGWCD